MFQLYSYWNEDFGYRFSISSEILASAPRWHEDEDFPPLSPRIAIANSYVAVQSILEEVAPFDPNLMSCALTPAPEGAWLYVVNWLVPQLIEQEADPTDFSVPVLFDGSTPTPLKFRFEDRFEIYRLP